MKILTTNISSQMSELQKPPNPLMILWKVSSIEYQHRSTSKIKTQRFAISSKKCCRHHSNLNYPIQASFVNQYSLTNSWVTQ